MDDDVLRKMANTAFDVLNWARREGMKRDEQIEQVVAGLKVDLSEVGSDTPTIDEIARENRESWAGKRLWAIVEDGDGFTVHQHTSGGVAPATTYPTARAAASRILQLLHIGPVAPQTEPETVCIGSIETSPE